MKLMITAEYKGINSFLVGAANLLVEKGIKRTTRGFNCIELPEPFFFKINQPTSRWVTIPDRKWKIILPYAESLWIAKGRNDLDFIRKYLKRMEDFSDDGLYLHGAYGPRIRYFNGNSNDYQIPKLTLLDNHISNKEVDQFKYIEDCFRKDINTRQAIINIGDPAKDCFIQTKDLPCTRLLHFHKQANCNKLDLTVFMRSNDLIWGASAVNIFNYTFMLEYVSQIVGLEIGNYYHFATNFHYYERHTDLVRKMANSLVENDESYTYLKSFKNFDEFDILLSKLEVQEANIYSGKIILADLEDDFFSDWLKVIYLNKTKRKVKFTNPILNNYFNF